MPCNQTKQTGALLVEVALALSLIAVMSLPLMRLNQSQKAQQAVQDKKQERQYIMEQIEGFILSQQRLPCPAAQRDGVESWLNGTCQTAKGWLPLQSLGLAPQTTQWEMAVATLEQVGPPAANAFFAEKTLHAIGLQQLSEIIFAPPTESVSVEETALPALHICILNPNEPLPPPTTHGCGAHALQTATAVLVVYETGTQAGTHQFFIQANAPEHNPTWLSYERLVWLWMRAGVLDQSTME